MDDFQINLLAEDTLAVDLPLTFAHTRRVQTKGGFDSTYTRRSAPCIIYCNKSWGRAPLQDRKYEYIWYDQEMPHCEHTDTSRCTMAKNGSACASSGTSVTRAGPPDRVR
jgi:hypothetical protein